MTWRERVRRCKAPAWAKSIMIQAMDELYRADFATVDGSVIFGGEIKRVIDDDAVLSDADITRILWALVYGNKRIADKVLYCKASVLRSRKPVSARLSAYCCDSDWKSQNKELLEELLEGWV